jgi:hypothetical protein
LSACCDWEFEDVDAEDRRLLWRNRVSSCREVCGCCCCKIRSAEVAWAGEDAANTNDNIQ